MARGERNAGWSGFFLTFTVFAAILLLLAREGQGEAVSAGARQVLVIYEGLTCWAVPALFMAWGMAALEEGKPIPHPGRWRGWSCRPSACCSSGVRRTPWRPTCWAAGR